MRGFGLAFLWMVFTFVACAKAGEVPSWQKWIEDLGSPSFQVRDRATKRLLDAGEKAGPALKLASLTADLEIRRRIEIILANIDRDALIAELTRPKKVRIHFKDVATETAFNHAGRDLGFPQLVLRRPFASIISVDTGEVPYWDAWEKLLLTAELIDLPSSTRFRLEKKSFLEMKVIPTTSFSLVPKTPAGRGTSKTQRSFLEEHSGEDAVFGFHATTSSSFRFRGFQGKSDTAKGGRRDSSFILDVQAEPRITWLEPPVFTLKSIQDDQGKDLLFEPITVRSAVREDDGDERLVGRVVVDAEEKARGYVSHLSIPEPALRPGAWRSLRGAMALRCRFPSTTLVVEDGRKIFAKPMLDRRGIALEIQAIHVQKNGKVHVDVWVSGPEKLSSLGIQKEYRKTGSGALMVRDSVTLVMNQLELVGPAGLSWEPTKVQRDPLKNDGHGRVFVSLHYSPTEPLDANAKLGFVWRAPRELATDIPFEIFSNAKNPR